MWSSAGIVFERVLTEPRKLAAQLEFDPTDEWCSCNWCHAHMRIRIHTYWQTLGPLLFWISTTSFWDCFLFHHYICVLSTWVICFCPYSAPICILDFVACTPSHWCFCQVVLTFPCCQALESYDGSCHPSGSMHHIEGLHLIEWRSLWSFRGGEVQLCCRSSSDHRNCEYSIWRLCGIFCPSKRTRKKKHMLFGNPLCCSLDHWHAFLSQPSHLHRQVAVWQLCVLQTKKLDLYWGTQPENWFYVFQTKKWMFTRVEPR